MTLAPDRVRAFYDRFGARQDAQAFYEDAAVERLLAAADFASAGSVFELGCGTGRVAARILAAFPDLHYIGVDVSATMVRLARARLSGWAGRATVVQVAPGTVAVPPADRIVSTYVLDLFSDAEIRRFLGAARRALGPRGKLCLAGLAEGPWIVPRLVSRAWGMLWRLVPQLVGGCRPIRLGDYLGDDWVRELSTSVTRWGITSEVSVLRPAASRGQQPRTGGRG